MKNRIIVYAGQYYDSETGLHYNYHRYYDPSLGRYLRADPSHSFQSSGIGIPFNIHEMLFIPQELNLFSYAQNNPLQYIDPNGLKSLKDYYDDAKDAESVIKACKDLFPNGEFKCKCGDIDKCFQCAQSLCEHYGPVGSPGFGACIIPAQKGCAVCLEN